MVCPHCGAELPDDIVYCGECGGDVRVAPASPSPRPTSRTTNARRVSEEDERAQNTRLGMGVVAGIAVVALVCAILALVLLVRH